MGGGFPFSIESSREVWFGVTGFNLPVHPQPNCELVKVETAVSVLGSSILSRSLIRYQHPTSEKFQLRWSTLHRDKIWRFGRSWWLNPDLIYPICSRYETFCDWMIARISQVMLIIRLGHIVRPYSWNKLQSYFLNIDRICRQSSIEWSQQPAESILHQRLATMHCAQNATNWSYTGFYSVPFVGALACKICLLKVIDSLDHPRLC